MVGEKGFEPSCLSAPAPEAGVYTKFHHTPMSMPCLRLTVPCLAEARPDLPGPAVVLTRGLEPPTPAPSTQCLYRLGYMSESCS